MAISDDGQVVAASSNDGIHVYDRMGASWVERPVLAFVVYSYIDLSGDGAVLATAVAGEVPVYAYDGVSWSEQGRLSGEAGSGFGQAVALSANGATLAVSALAAQQVHVYDFDGGAWSPHGTVDAPPTGHPAHDGVRRLDRPRCSAPNTTRA